MATDTQTQRTRYPGSRPFTRDDEALFFGRDNDITSLTTFIKVEKTIVLYGKSGLGKTSLLNAGVLPKLENEHQFRVLPLRFGGYLQGSLKHPLDIVEEKMAGFCQQECFLSKVESEDISLWQHIKSLEWALPNPTTFLLVFDQFEELFTYPEGLADFAEALADLLYSRVPKSFQRALRLATRGNADLLTHEQSEFLDRPLNLKVLMSIRSDRMSLLDRLSSHIPNILLNCYELKPLTRAQAEDAITSPARKAGDFKSPAFTYRPEALKKVLDYLTQKDSNPIESFQLQILCYYVEENIVIARNDTHVEEKDLGNLETIYQNYYTDTINKLGTEEEQLKARTLIEEGLIFEKENRRVSLYEGQINSLYNIDSDFLRRLADTHIIRSEPHSSGGYVYEISHDTLVPPILKAKAARYQRDQEEKARQEAIKEKERRKKIIKRAFALLGSLIALYLGIFIWILLYVSEKESKMLVFVAALIIFIVALLILTIPAALLIVYEFITGESFLSKLKRRVAERRKQKEVLTKVGRWLS
jgi:hypothetical protein